eukprot:TRINITY_DN38428_c0_g1_i1.p1 TRINITY_DN38428_c0_g1~~TRINITY_DN38428_c0_g1_i1.p1  ORF type:complete len:454 (-),score=26.55 TRINITY_DN38428_c0_g1_i1:360-1721(-)
MLTMICTQRAVLHYIRCQRQLADTQHIVLRSFCSQRSISAQAVDEAAIVKQHQPHVQSSLHVGMLTDLKSLIPECYQKMIQVDVRNSNAQEKSTSSEDEDYDEDDEDELENVNKQDVAVSWNMQAIEQAFQVNDVNIQKNLAYIGRKVVQLLAAEWSIANHKPLLFKQIDKQIINDAQTPKFLFKCFQVIDNNQKVLKEFRRSTESQFGQRSVANLLLAAIGGYYLQKAGGLSNLRLIRDRALMLELQGSTYENLVEALVRPMNLKRFPFYGRQRLQPTQKGIQEEQADRLFRDSSVFQSLFGDYYMHPYHRRPVLIMKALTCIVDGDDGETNRVMAWLGQYILSILDGELRMFQCLYDGMTNMQFYDCSSQDPDYRAVSEKVAQSLEFWKIVVGQGLKGRSKNSQGEMLTAVLAALYIDGGCQLHECGEWFYNNVGKNMQYQISLQKNLPKQ